MTRRIAHEQPWGGDRDVRDALMAERFGDTDALRREQRMAAAHVRLSDAQWAAHVIRSRP